jgi:hypothetical protein
VTTTKKTTSKKTSTKKTSAKKAPASLTPESHISVVSDSGVPKMAGRRRVKDAVPKTGISAAELMKKAGCRLATIEKMIARGFLAARAKS